MQMRDMKVPLDDKYVARVNIPYQQRPFRRPTEATKNISKFYADTVDMTVNIESSRTAGKYAADVRNSIILRQYVQQTD